MNENMQHIDNNKSNVVALILCLAGLAVALIAIVTISIGKGNAPAEITEETSEMGIENTCPITATYEAMTIIDEFDFYAYLIATEAKFDCSFGSEVWDSKVVYQ